ncbi:MAG TPA: flavodoxin family protein [Victivallales bacterium]|nr:flavodoxin family protein [Victivallales bacterium]
MKVIAFNGSPRKNGNTSIMIHEVFKELNQAGIETEEINIGIKSYKGCTFCKKCHDNIHGHCVINDGLNDCFEKLKEADGIILGSPVYCAELSGQMKCFIDRIVTLVFVNGGILTRKVGASVVALRRAGALPAFHAMNSFFSVVQMITVGSGYWNLGFGLNEGEVREDEEGIKTMVNLGKNMAWILKSIDGSKEKVKEPDTMRTH